MKLVPIALAAGFLTHTVLSQSTLKDLAAAKGKYISAAAVNSDTIDPTFARILSEQFHGTTPGNEMKWDATEPKQGVFNFANGDKLVAFAQSKGLIVRGHTLVWHSQLPSWVANGNWTRDTLTAVIQNHIANVAGHYKGQVVHWDVVNEVFKEDGTWRPSVLYNVLGEDFVPIAFNAARAADPDAKLFINDYNIDGKGPESTAMYNLVQKLKAQGVPIDGIGSQAHLIVGTVPSSFQDNLQTFASLDVDVAITEMDIRTATPITPEKSQQQMLDYQQTVGACVNTPRCGQGDALLWDRYYNRKAAHSGVVLALGGTPDPLTTSTLPTAVGAVPIHIGWGLEPGWKNWGWSVDTDVFYAGPPASIVGDYALKGTTKAGSFGVGVGSHSNSLPLFLTSSTLSDLFHLLTPVMAVSTPPEVENYPGTGVKPEHVHCTVLHVIQVGGKKVFKEPYGKAHPYYHRNQKGARQINHYTAREAESAFQKRFPNLPFMGIERASASGDLTVLDFWGEWFRGQGKVSATPGRYYTWGDEAMDAASANGLIWVLQWWKESGLELRYSQDSMALAGKYGHVEVLKWWKDSSLELRYNSESMDYATHRGHVEVLDWWYGSGLPLKYSNWALDGNPSGVDKGVQGLDRVRALE
ncbi:hypothetical protein HDV00_005833 [Rhizophlyctis rosea]|nr:hypothetical protein HDV00_005833 [Rhizophlyctis rosea]